MRARAWISVLEAGVRLFSSNFQGKGTMYGKCRALGVETSGPGRDSSATL